MVPDVCSTLPIPRRLPAKSNQNSSDPSLFARSDASAFHTQSEAGDIADANPRKVRHMRGDRVLPHVSLETVVLLRFDAHAFEVPLGPPSVARPIADDRLSKELVAIVAQRV